uniref:Galactosylgalactosylxylosylprotein 3-beta-glucuronosyltransferase n=1 Tax=Romanomermis culicivorax TaxID=13658 RepID=A0A915HHM9_ROMCU
MKYLFFVVNLLCLFFIWRIWLNGPQSYDLIWTGADMCSSQHYAKKINHSRKIYMITPTYKRDVRKAEMTRLAQTLINVPNFHWIVVEDGKATDPVVRRLLERLNLNFTYIFEPKPTIKNITARGFSQRNKALALLKEKYDENLAEAWNTVVYFGDDDNTYDLRLFNEMRKIRKIIFNIFIIGMWPVAFCGGLKLEKLFVRNGTLTGFDVWWARKSRFRIDMAGFAINLGYLLTKSPRLPRFLHRGSIETSFLQQFLKNYGDIEPINLKKIKISSNDDDGREIEEDDDDDDRKMNEVLVWHTKTKKLDLVYEKNYSRHFKIPSDYGWEI